MKLILAELGQGDLSVTPRDEALNERDYGDLSGLNKDEARKKWGEDQVPICGGGPMTCPRPAAKA